jgi:UDP-N-acetyl-2-amino-2-deoxyglucuronate dehydrogenase
MSSSAAAAAAANNNDSAQEQQRRRLGLAIVGCGQIVTHHLGAIASELEGKYVVRALCDPSATRRTILGELIALGDSSSQPQSPAQFNTLQELIADEKVLDSVDIIFIAVPHDLHETLAMQALALKDKIVVMEKPLAPTAEQCDRLVQVSNAGDHAMLVIAEQSPYWQEVVRAKELISEGAIGNIVTAAAYYYESMRDNVTSGNVDSDGGLGWRGSIERAGGGIAIDGGLHWIRPLREMCGRIEEVVGTIRRNLAPNLKMEGESLGHALFKMSGTSGGPLQQPAGSGPLVATYSCNMLATAPMAHDACPYFRVTGDKGELIIHGDGLFKENPGAGGLRLYNDEYPKGKELFAADRKGGFFLGFAGLWQEIHRICVDKDRAAAHETVVRASDDVHVILALYKSSETGRWEPTSSLSAI